MPPRPERHGSAEAAVADIPDGASILVAGFHAGVPWNLMRALHGQGASDLVMISTTVNRPLLDVDGRVTIADLVAAGRVRRVVASFTAAPHPSQPNDAERVFREGGAEAELVPQGTLAERIRAGGAGIPAFYAPAGVGSAWAAGRETRAFGGREGERQGLRLDGGATLESGLPHPLEKRGIESHFLEPGVGEDAGRAGRVGLVGPLAITVQLVSNGARVPSS